MKKKYLLMAIVGFVAGLAGGLAAQKNGPAVAAPTVYDRVMQAHTLRCGYVVWPVFLTKDPNSGRLSGLFYDYTEALGKALNLKIDWAEEESWGEFPAALDSGRIDAMCGGSWANAERVRRIDFVRPILYQPMYLYVRNGDTRFDGKLDAVNDPATTLVFIEGSTQAVVANSDFPAAQKLSLPQLTPLSDVMLNLTEGKADIALTNNEAAHQFDVNNPGKIRRIDMKTPLRIFGNSIAVAGGQERFRRMLDLGTDALLSSGEVEKIIEKYETVPGALLRAAPPYANQESK